MIDATDDTHITLPYWLFYIMCGLCGAGIEPVLEFIWNHL